MKGGELSTTAKNIIVITANGHVTLRGPVKTAQEKAKIDQLAKSAAGNTWVARKRYGRMRSIVSAVFRPTASNGSARTRRRRSLPRSEPDGGFSCDGMVVDRFGDFYGATVDGGEADDGCDKFTP